MAGSTKFVAEQLINPRLIEPNPRIIHHAGHSHEVQIGAQHNQTVRHICGTEINIDR
jgi:hypothetical protein